MAHYTRHNSCMDTRAELAILQTSARCVCEAYLNGADVNNTCKRCIPTSLSIDGSLELMMLRCDGRWGGVTSQLCKRCHSGLPIKFQHDTSMLWCKTFTSSDPSSLEPTCTLQELYHTDLSGCKKYKHPKAQTSKKLENSRVHHRRWEITSLAKTGPFHPGRPTTKSSRPPAVEQIPKTKPSPSS